MTWGNGTEFSLASGSILEFEADAIVVTINDQLDLSKGQVARQLLQLAGEGIQHELKGKAGPHHEPGDVIATAGHGLRKAKTVFHAIMGKWDGRGAEDNLRRVVQTCLEEAEKMQHTSIAFPALGTGQLKTPANVCARVIMEEVEKFLRAVESPSIKRIYAVIYDRTTKQPFEHELSCRVSGSRGAEAASPRQAPAPVAERRGGPPRGSHDRPATSGQSLHTDIGGIKVVVKTGNILHDDSQVIVHPSDARGSFQGAIGRALQKKFGDGLVMQVQKKVDRLAKYGTCHTAFKGKSVLHVNCGQGKSINDIIKTILMSCEHFRVNAVAIPAIGTGKAGGAKSVGDIADETLKAINKFSQSKSGGSVRRVALLTGDRLLEAYQDALSKRGGSGTRHVALKGGGHTRGSKKGDVVVFWVYSENASSVPAVRDDIRRACDREFKSEKIQNEVLLKIRDQEKKKLYALAQKHNVIVNLRGNKLFLEGGENALFKASLEADRLIKSWSEFHQEKKVKAIEASGTRKAIQWRFCKKNNEWTDYWTDANMDLETAYLDLKKKQTSGAQVKVRVDRKRGVSTVVVDGNDQHEEQMADRTKIEVRRVDLTEVKTVALPARWKPMQPGQKVEKVELQPGNSEYQQVVTALQSTGGRVTIYKIFRIQHPEKYKLYQVRKEEMSTRNGGRNDEKLLWHGTAPDTVESIIQNGFNRSYCGKNGTAYGQGVYYAVQSSYSLGGYARKDPSTGIGNILYCRVLTGQSIGGSPSYTLPPFSSPPDRYDSCSGPGMFIIFHDNQVYPEYLVQFR